MRIHKPSVEPPMVVVGWQGITAEILPDWHIAAISGDYQSGYVRYDDDVMPRLEIKWASETGFVNLEAVLDKYLRELQKGRRKGDPEVLVERDVQLISRGKRKKSGLKCFQWRAETQGHGAAWVCKDCGRTMIAQVTNPADMDPEAAKELAATILLGIQDHPSEDWILWSAYGFDCRVPKAFQLSGQKLMAGLIELQFACETETIRLARWGMANVALKRKSLAEWLSAQMGKALRKHKPQSCEATVNGHPGLHISGGDIAGYQKLQRFYLHCKGKLFADRLIGRAWHCEETNRIFYVETFVDRANVGLADELAARIVCHPGATSTAPPEQEATDESGE